MYKEEYIKAETEIVLFDGCNVSIVTTSGPVDDDSNNAGIIVITPNNGN